MFLLYYQPAYAKNSQKCKTNADCENASPWYGEPSCPVWGSDSGSPSPKGPDCLSADRAYWVNDGYTTVEMDGIQAQCGYSCIEDKPLPKSADLLKSPWWGEAKDPAAYTCGKSTGWGNGITAAQKKPFAIADTVDCHPDNDLQSIGEGFTQSEMNAIRAHCPRSCHSCVQPAVVPAATAGMCFSDTVFAEYTKVRRFLFLVLPSTFHL